MKSSYSAQNCHRVILSSILIFTRDEVLRSMLKFYLEDLRMENWYYLYNKDYRIGFQWSFFKNILENWSLKCNNLKYTQKLWVGEEQVNRKKSDIILSRKCIIQNCHLGQKGLKGNLSSYYFPLLLPQKLMLVPLRIRDGCKMRQGHFLL